MKHLLLATSALVATTGFAAAEISLSGSARMGIISDFGDTGAQFTSRVRVNFGLSGETDGGLAFGASVRNDQSGQGNTANDDSTVFISMGGHKLSMGDVDGAANAAIGHVSGVGLTGLGDLNEVTYISNGGTDWNGDGDVDDLDDIADTSVLYEYAMGDFAFYLSSTQVNRNIGGEAMSAAAKYTTGAYSVAIGYEQLDAFDNFLWEQYSLGGSATFGAVTLKAIYIDGKLNVGDDWDQYAVSVDYVADALTLTAFVANNEDMPGFLGGGEEGYGVGASYDLGGGAKVAGGYAKDRTNDDSAFDVGLSFSF
jgi:outer membrane protein OmpU